MLKNKINSFLINSLLNSQVHIGKKKKKWDKSLNIYLFGLRHNIFFFNLKKTHLFIKRMVFFLYNSIINHKVCLFVGTNTFIHPIIDYLKFSLNQPGVNIVWVGGTLTNWFKVRNYATFLHSKNISKTIYSRFALKAADKVSQKILRYYKMKGRLKGLEKAYRFPNILICFEKTWNEFVLHEAFILRLPTICLVNSSEKCANIAFPIYGNTNSFESLSFYSNIIMSSIKKGFIKRRLSFLHVNYLVIPPSIIFNPKAIAKSLNNFNLYHNDYAKFRLKRLVRRVYYFNNFWKVQKKKMSIRDKRNLTKYKSIQKKKVYYKTTTKST